MPNMFDPVPMDQSHGGEIKRAAALVARAVQGVLVYMQRPIAHPVVAAVAAIATVA